MDNYTASTVIETPSVSNEQQYTSTDTLSNGDYIVVYSSDHTSNGTYHIYGQKYDTDGNEVGSETQLSSTSSSLAMRPVVAARSDGFVVTWCTATSIYRRRFNNSMIGQTNETLVDNGHGNYGSDFHRYHSHINTFSDDGYVISYNDISGTPDNKTVFQIFDSSDNQTVSETTAVHKTSGNGNTWFHWGAIATDTGTYGAETFAIFSYGPDGDMFGFAAEQDGTQISSNTTNFVGTRIISSNNGFPVAIGNGDHFLLTHEDMSNSPREVRLYTIDQDLTGLTEQDSSNPINIDDVNSQRHAPITILDNGDVVITFMHWLTDHWNVHAQYYDYNSGGAAGMKYTQNGDPATISTENNDQYLPSITNSGDSFMITWADENNATGDWDVRHIFYNITVCLLKGTEVLTETGYRPIETLVAGDLVFTDDFSLVPVIQTKRFTVPRSTLNHPIVFLKDGLSPGRPSKDLWLSPNHKVNLRARMKRAITIEAHQSGVIVAPETPSTLVYYHLEVEGRRNIIAHGLVVESYHPRSMI